MLERVRLIGEERDNYRLALAGAVLVCVVVILVGLLWVSLAKAGPKEVVTDYLASMQAKDYPRAYSLLTPEAQKAVVKPDGVVNTAIGAMLSRGMIESYVVGKPAIDKDRAVVEVTFKVSGTDVPVKLTLIKVGGRWRIET